MRLGVIGAGWWAAEHHLPVLRQIDGVEIASVCGLDPAALRAVQETFGIAHATQDYRALLALPDLDGVIVSSPHDCHYEHTMAALDRGLHVLCEKPMALYAREARAMAARANAVDRQLLLPYGWNYTGFAADARAQVANGAIGELLHVQLHMASALGDLFDGRQQAFADSALVKPGLGTWSDPARGGGFGHGQLTHALALLFWITDLQPAEVFACTHRSSTGADLAQTISCRFTNGAIGSLGGAATRPPDSLYQIDIRLFGTDGMLLLDIERPRLELLRHDGVRLETRMTHRPGAYDCVEPLRTFVDLVRGCAAENRSNAALGVRVVELLDAAFRSAASGRLEQV